jgi:hypothetical protein
VGGWHSPAFPLPDTSFFRSVSRLVSASSCAGNGIPFSFKDLSRLSKSFPQAYHQKLWISVDESSAFSHPAAIFPPAPVLDHVLPSFGAEMKNPFDSMA